VTFDRWGNITSELTNSLVRSLVLPAGILAKLKEMLGEPRKGENTPPRCEPDGPLMICASLPVPDEIIVSYIYLVGGRSSKIQVLAVGADPTGPLVTGALKALTRYGMTKVDLLHLPDRATAESAEVIAQLADAQGLVVVGERTAEALGILAASAVHQTLQRFGREKLPVLTVGPVGALMGEVLFLDEAGVAPGLGLVRGMLVVTDWQEPARSAQVTRLLAGEGGRPLLGIGLEPGMAVLFRGGGEAKVYGPGGVTFVDGFTTAKEGASAPKVHVLMEHYVMNLRSRRPGGPVKEIPAASGGQGRHA
jgi:cyanophycinase-like exopeptidase